MDDLTSRTLFRNREDNEKSREKKGGVFHPLQDPIQASFPEVVREIQIMNGLPALETRVKEGDSKPSHLLRSALRC